MTWNENFNPTWRVNHSSHTHWDIRFHIPYSHTPHSHMFHFDSRFSFSLTIETLQDSVPYPLFSYPSFSYVLFWFPILISTYDPDAPRGVWYIINEPSYTESEHQIHVLVFGLTVLWQRMRSSIPLERHWHIYSHLSHILHSHSH